MARQSSPGQGPQTSPPSPLPEPQRTPDGAHVQRAPLRGEGRPRNCHLTSFGHTAGPSSEGPSCHPTRRSWEPQALNAPEGLSLQPAGSTASQEQSPSQVHPVQAWIPAWHESSDTLASSWGPSRCWKRLLTLICSCCLIFVLEIDCMLLA